MKTKIKKEQIKTYKDILDDEIGDKFYDIDFNKEKKYLDEKKKNKKNLILLIKILITFIAIALIYFLASRNYFKKNETPVYFSNYFHQKIIADDEYYEVIDDNKIKNVDISYIEKTFDDKVDKTNFFNILYVYNNDKNNASLQDILLSSNKGFVKEDVGSFGRNFSIGQMVLKNDKRYFAFLEVNNFPLANKYLKEWESRLFSSSNNSEIDYGFLSKNILNNKTRVAMTSNGEFIFGYSFINKNVLVFFNNEEAFMELIRKNIIVK